MSISQAKALYTKGIIDFNQDHFINPNGIIDSVSSKNDKIII